MVFRENQSRIRALHIRQVAMEAEKEASRINQERLTRMIAALSETNDAILRADTREKLFKLVCEAATLGGKFVGTAILLATPGDAFFRLVGVTGIEVKRLDIFKLPTSPKSGLAAVTFHTGKPCISNDYQATGQLSAATDLLRNAGVKALACLPLMVRDRPAGVLGFGSEDDGTFTPEYVEVLQRLANNVSFALENFDRSEEKNLAEERIRYLATHDSLTGLPNRAMFNQLMDFSLKNAGRYERKCAVLFIDLDRFKLINDSLGHAAGDALLIEMAARLRSVLRASDVVARMGGDEFMILLNEVTENGQAATIAESVLSALCGTLLLNGHECRVTASIGIAMYPDDGVDEETLMKNADSAMYLAKADGKNGVRFFSSDKVTHSIDHLKIEASLQHALDRGELCLHYQPKLDVASGTIAGVEALLRWNHPEMGLLPPIQFIPLAEETGLIVPIGRWVLNAACNQNMAWQRAGLPPVTVAVNVSPRQFSDEHLLRDIDAALAVSGMDPKYLEIEITESMVMLNVERAVRVLEAIQSRGIGLAIDDFGTGYSSMSMLKRFPIDTIKIDRSFVRDLPQNAEDKAIAQAIISMAKALGLKIIAEGVETISQDQFLRNNDCDEIQGYLFSKPLPADQLALLLAGPHAASPEPLFPVRKRQSTPAKSSMSLKV
jgi:diguanylate cyclase (GGDEF)-like protein